MTAIHHVRIRQLQSEIQDRLYSPAHHLSADEIEHHTPPHDWFVSMRERLVQWRRNAPAPMGFCSNTWFDLNYHITLTLLHRPSPRYPKPSKESLRVTRQASSAVMRSYKEMLKTGRVNWSGSKAAQCAILLWLMLMSRLAGNVSTVHRRNSIPQQPVAGSRAGLDHCPFLR